MILFIVLSAVIGLICGMLTMYLATVRARKIPSLTKYVAFSIAVMIIYGIAELVLATITGNTHDTLTTCLFGVFGGEILSCALIKIFKLKEDKDDE